MSRAVVLRWDLDKTYLATNFESLRGLMRIPFERGRDKVAIRAAVPLIHELRSDLDRRRISNQMFFLSASPPQLGRAIRDKLKLDGVRTDGITFKDQVGHLVRGRFDAIREQIGYKLSELLRAGADPPRPREELLFGDDWESDPFTYSLYADIVAGKISPARVAAILEMAEVDPLYRRAIEGHTQRVASDVRVRAIFVLRQKPRSAQALSVFGPRLVWFDDYLEGSLRLHALGLLGGDAVARIARHGNFSAEEISHSLRLAGARLWGPTPASLVAARRALVANAGAECRPDGFFLARVWALARGRLGLSPSRLPTTGFVPDYEGICARWSRRGCREDKGAALEGLASSGAQRESPRLGGSDA